MNNPELDLSRRMDAAGAGQAQLDAAPLAEERQKTARDAGMDITGPGQDVYDYSAVDITESPDGGYDLPNKGIKNLRLAGRDANTGEVFQQREDPDGFGEVGMQRVRDNYTNTETGAPADAYNGLIPLAAEHIQNGGTPDDFNIPYPDEMKKQAFATLQSVASVQAISAKLEALPAAPEEPSEEASLTLDDLKADEAWKASAAIVSEYMGVEDQDPETLAEDGVEEMAAVFSSLSKISAIIYGVESGDMPEDVQQAYLHMAQTYEKFTPWDWNNLQGMAVGMAVDAPLYAAGGGVGTFAVKQAGKTGAIKMLIQKLNASIVAGAAVGAVEGATFEGGSELMMQKLSGENDLNEVFNKAGVGALGGVIIGSAFGTLLSEPGRRSIVRGYNAVADEMAKLGTVNPMGRQRGSLGNAPAYTDIVPSKTTDMGVVMADTTTGEYYSKLFNTVGGEKPILTIGKKGQHADQLLKAIQGRQKKGDFKQYEMEESGLVQYLTDKGKTSVTKEEIEDYLWANRPRVNSLISSNISHHEPGTESYVMKPVERLRRNEAVRAFKDRFFTTTRVSVPVDTSIAVQSTQKYLSEFDTYLAQVNKARTMEADPMLYPEDAPLTPQLPSINSVALGEVDMRYRSDLFGYAQRKGQAYLAGEDFNEALPTIPAEPRKGWSIHNKVNGHTEQIMDDNAQLEEAGLYISDQARATLKNMTDDQVVQLVRDHDVGKIMAPPKWGHSNGDFPSLTIIKGEDANKYQEMRLFLPYDGMTSPETVAMERFGKIHADLSTPEKARVKRIMQLAKDKPKVAFMEEQHYPLEHNRLANIRTQELFAADGTPILAVNEIQSDMSVAMRRLAKGSKLEDIGEGNNSLIDDFGWDESMEMPTPSKQSTEGWIPMTLNRTFQLAQKQGYDKVSLPIDADMIAHIQNWDGNKVDEKARKGTVNFYQNVLARWAKNDKTLKKNWGITKIEEMDVYPDNSGADAVPGKMLVIHFDPKKKGPKAIYGTGALSAGTGATMLDQKEDKL